MSNPPTRCAGGYSRVLPPRSVRGRARQRATLCLAWFEETVPEEAGGNVLLVACVDQLRHLVGFVREPDARADRRIALLQRAQLFLVAHRHDADAPRSLRIQNR